MKTESLPLRPAGSAPNAERQGHRITTVNFAGRSAGRHHPPGSRVAVGDLPIISQPLHRLFTWYARRYLRRHFHSLRVSRASALPVKTERPLVIYSNHASWWDPLVALVLAQEFLTGRSVFAPIDAAALARYGFFKRLGAFGVEQGTRHGAGQFLRRARRILQNPEHTLWLTPQSRFADARERPVNFKAGIGHLPQLVGPLCFVPVAIEYVFWEERLPEILVRFGASYETSPGKMPLAPAGWTEFFAGRLAENQNALAAEAGERQPEKFRCLLRGPAGVGGVYDRWRALKAKARGQAFQAQHGKL